MSAKPALAAALLAAFQRAAAFAGDPLPVTGGVDAAVAQDLSGPVVLDAQGCSAGARTTILDPGARHWRQWRILRAAVQTQLEPYRADMQAVDHLPDQRDAISHTRDDALARINAAWQALPRNVLISGEWHTAQTVYEAESLRHGQRLANMAATSPFYWIGLLAIGVAEWLINYDTFLLFTGVVAIAAGATITLAVLLAFAAHGHGELLKQWSFRFGAFQTRQTRVGSWRMLGLSTVAVLVVLAAAGGSRYAAAMRSLAHAVQPDLIGGGYTLDVNPSRDVLLSLLANVAAWIVGIFISYFCHDVDPDFMGATAQHRRAGRAYFRARRRLEQETQTLQERAVRDIAALERGAGSRAAAAEAPRMLALQLEQHEASVLDGLLAQLRGGLHRYRLALLEAAAQRQPPVPVTGADGGAATADHPPIVLDQAVLEQAG